jgi:hypothetical protein
MRHFLVEVPAGSSRLTFHWFLRANRLPGEEDFLDFTGEALQPSRFAKGDYIHRLLLADCGMAGMSCGRLAVAMSTLTVQHKTATVLLSQG